MDMRSIIVLELRIIRYMLYSYTKFSMVSATVSYFQPELISEFLSTSYFQFKFVEMFFLIDLVT